MIATSAPFSQYFDKNGDPLDSGYVYFGVPDANPETSPIPAFWDEAGTQPVAQPARTLAGYIVRNGTPARVYVEGAYSQTVKNKKGELVYYAANSEDYSNLPVNVATIEATAGQTNVNLPFSYTRGNNSLAVYLNGSLLLKDRDYIETSETAIQMLNPLKIGPGGADEVTAIGGRLINPSSAVGTVSAAALAAGSGAGLVGYDPSLTFPADTVGERLQRTTFTVDAIASVDAPALGLVDGDVIVAKGRDSVGDGGGGEFLVETGGTAEPGTSFSIGGGLYAVRADLTISNAEDYGLGGAVATNTALNNLVQGPAIIKTIPAGAHTLTSTWAPPKENILLIEDGNATFNGGFKADYTNLIPYQIRPLHAQQLLSRTWGSEWNTYYGIFQNASFADNQSDALVVAQFGEAVGNVTNARVWGGNFVAYANITNSFAIGVEINCGILSPSESLGPGPGGGGEAYGLVIASAGSGGQSENAIQVLSNSVNGQFKDGIRLLWRASEGLLTKTAIKLEGSTFSSCEKFLQVSSVAATVAEIDFPSFTVEATRSAPANRLSVRGANAGAAVELSATGSDTNVTIAFNAKGTGVHAFTGNGKNQFRVRGDVAGDDYLRVSSGAGGGLLDVSGSSTNADVVVIGKGTGGVRLQNGSGVNRVQVNGTGIGFFGVTPAAQPSSASVTDFATLKTALQNLGLIGT